MATHDIEPAHYPTVDRPVVAMAKEFSAGSDTGWHDHRRAQLIFAVTGLMIAATADGTWAVPRGHALWMPSGVRHTVTMRGAVAMRTIYVAEDAAWNLPAQVRVIAASPLLQAVLVALSQEPALYDRDGRGGNLAALALDEVRRTPATPFALAVPADPRLARLARALIADPGSPHTIDDWADIVGASRRTLTRLFRRQTGLSFGTWRRRLRLLEAAARRADGEPLGRVAASLGYTSLAAFRTMARREFGAGPGAVLL